MRSVVHILRSMIPWRFLFFGKGPPVASVSRSKKQTQCCIPDGQLRVHNILKRWIRDFGCDPNVVCNQFGIHLTVTRLLVQ